ncbi:hypothetical protein Taro_045866 [Colocasia esculenta]|uniref:Calmodulin-binding heat-shock protein n=1 Tax=Colocasia esculenta TaxID=4460 RepID=A0A843WXM2_COLES|nr:hypothetical protein [Colocasia esculenta]
MSIICGVPLLESVCCLGCVGWAWKRFLHTGIRDSEAWALASADEFEPVPRLCRLILAVYEDDLEHPLGAPPGGYGINPSCVRLRKTYRDTQGRAPPHLIYVDHENADIVVAIRGLNLGKESDYALLLDNRLGKKKIDGGYVHNGLLKAAAWILDEEGEILKELLDKHPEYSLTFAGHSLGSGVAAMLAMLVVQNSERLGNVGRRRVRCYAMAPARCMSLNLAIKYAHIINSIVLQASSCLLLGLIFLILGFCGRDCSVMEDDFLPRTATPLEDIFKSVFCLPCLLCLRCMRDTCIPEEKMFRDPRRLYAPGRIYHIVERKPFRFGKFPPVVRTAVPVDGRFEHLVPSCNATSDHAIVWIEKEARKALDLMLEKERTLEIPAKQRMERQETIAREHKEEYRAALHRAVTLSIPHAFSPSAYGTFEGSTAEAGEGSTASRESSKKESWGELIERLFEKDESGQMVLRKSAVCDIS